MTTATAPRPNRLWRTAKWNGSAMCSRAASAGLEVKDSTTPMAMSSTVAPSSQRSTVHHQTPSRLESVRLKAWGWSWT